MDLKVTVTAKSEMSGDKTLELWHCDVSNISSSVASDLVKALSLLVKKFMERVGNAAKQESKTV